MRIAVYDKEIEDEEDSYYFTGSPEEIYKLSMYLSFVNCNANTQGELELHSAQEAYDMCISSKTDMCEYSLLNKEELKEAYKFIELYETK